MAIHPLDLGEHAEAGRRRVFPRKIADAPYCCARLPPWDADGK